MTVFLVLFVLIVISYSFLLYDLITGWDKLEVSQNNGTPVFISVIIAARNEEKNITQTLNALVEQSYPSRYFELIIVDDASDDSTAEIIRSYCAEYPHFRLISFKEHKGKKAAIDFAIKQASGSLIVQTDADCFPNNQWLEIIANEYSVEPAQMIIAPVLMEYKNIFEGMQALDFLSLMASGMALAGLNKPIMNNAANLTFEKEAYLSLKNPNNQDVVSGDDVFFLLSLKR